ncbi:hypothetical protein TCAL_10514 [Tigriopus californicus]|uniref:SWIM-type domain-containing protein n=1 Tax=Tigriopus californicus TaxID=6832 RepID=A0A553P2E9_TIGCA|nr:uncharacterized protein LOC131882940 [Tigriopus californicus]TRY71878.1 hypothetical protein TCAL_10514 [Tigriopus californicus]
MVVKKLCENDVLEQYLLIANDFPCNRVLCQIRCSKCPPSNICGHTFVCNCPNYAREGNCKHLHLVAMELVCPSPHPDHDYCGTTNTLDPYDVSEEQLVEISDEVKTCVDFEDADPPENGMECVVERTKEEVLQSEGSEKAFFLKLESVWSKVLLRLSEPNIPLGVREAKLKTILTLVENEDKIPLTIFPKLDGKRKRERVPSLFPKNPKKCKKEMIQCKPASLRKELLEQCVKAPLNEVCWMYRTCYLSINKTFYNVPET